MYKRILLPTDFSENAWNAIRYALDLYKDQNCDFYFLNAYQVNGYTIDTFMVPEPSERAYKTAQLESRRGFEKLLETLKLHSNNPKHLYHTISTFNTLLEALKSTIAKHDIDMVIMGTQGMTGADSVLFGTNTVDAMEKISECPVMAIPQNARFRTPKEIVFPTDYKTNFKRKELNYLLEIALYHKAAIRVLHIEKEFKLSRDQKNNKELLQSILEGTEHSFHSLKDLKVRSGISAFIKSRDSDMIAFINRRHKFFGNILAKPLVKAMGYHSKIPVLTLNDAS